MVLHFAAIDSAEPAKGQERSLDFYRVTIEGVSGNGLTEFQTGYYDAEALHQLFGQVSDEKNGDRTVTAQEQGDSPRSGQVVVQIDPTTGKHRVVERDERFTIIWGNNADAVTQQISAFAQADSTGEALAGLIAQVAGREDFALLREARVQAEERERNAEALADDLERISKKIEQISTEDADQAAFLPALHAQLRDAIQRALRQAGYTGGAALSDDVDTPGELQGVVTEAKRRFEAMREN